MSNNESFYVTVKQGDCIYSLAARYGFSADALLSHANNQTLVSQRPDATQLVPGDKVFIPAKKVGEVEAETGVRHRFRRKGTLATFKATFMDFDKPLAKLRYVLYANGKYYDGTTDDDGCIEITLDATITTARLTIGTEPEAFEYTLHMGGLDPADTITGQQQRLSNLGHYSGKIDGTNGELTKAAIREFKINQKLTVDDQLDPAALTQLSTEASS